MEDTIEVMTPAEEEAEILDKLNAIGDRLQGMVLAQVAQRAEIEDRWLEDLRQYNGRYDPDTEAALRDDKKKSRIFVNKTRNKTNAAEARLGDMVLPTDDRNWTMKPTPNPKVDMAIGSATPTAEGSTEGQVAETAKQVAADRARLMQNEIDDQLTECQYNQVCRQVIHDAALYGTGILKGPVIVGKTRRAWKNFKDESGSVHVLQTEELHRPIAERVDPWDFFPDMTASRIEDAEFVFERNYMPKRKVRELIKRPGFVPEQVLKVLLMDPKETQITASRIAEIREIGGVTATPDDNRYEVWSYYGPFTREDLEVCGCEFEEDETPVDALYEGVVWFVGNVVIKAVINPMDTEDRPFSVVNWERDDSGIFGFGVPYQMRNPQKVINASWRMTLENAGLSTGPQIVYNQEIIQPADGNWELRPRKEWRVTDRNAPVANAFATFDIASHQPELMAIFSAAMKLADEETSLPVIQQGEMPQQMPTTVGVTAMIQGAANVILRRVVKFFDDDLTTPTIRRFYDWNMQYNPNEEIKGDYEVDARGSSSLMAKEMQTQHLIQWMGYASNPVFAPAIKAPEILKKVAIAQQIPYAEVVKTEEEMKADAQRAAENKKEDPAVTKARIEQENLKYKMDITDKMNQDRLAAQQRENEIKVFVATKEYEVAILKLMSDREMSAEQVQAELAKVTMQVEGSAEREMIKAMTKGAGL